MRLPLVRAARIAAERGHPWVYREGIAVCPSPIETGTVVDLFDERERFVARGLWDEESPIAVRIFTRDERRRIDRSIFVERVEDAIAKRARLFDDGTNAYRVVNGEGDHLPGLVIDRYADVAVMKIDTAAISPYVADAASAIEAALATLDVTSVGLRVDADERVGSSKLEPFCGARPPQEVVVREHGMEMVVDLARGQKTGAFLDQRENRRRVRGMSTDARVLNLFSYAGGFSIAAALGGAAKVVSIDLAAAAHATAQKSFRRNNLDPAAHEFVSADVFAYLDSARARGDRFDLIISDPPSFAPREKARERAMAAYRKLHTSAVAVLATGGTLCAASCSSHITMEDFLSTFDGDLSILATFGQPEDHPTRAAWFEGRYLKFVVAAV